MEQRWRGIKTWHFPPSLSPNLLEAASPPLGGKKKSHQREGVRKKRAAGPSSARPDPGPSAAAGSSRWLGAEDAPGPAGSARPRRLRLAPTAARSLPGRSSRGREEKKVGGRGGGSKGEGRAGGGEGREPSLLFISS